MKELKTWLMAALMMTAAAACHDTSDDDWDDGGGSTANVNANDTSVEPALQRLEFPHVKGGSSLVLIHTTNDSWGINYSVEWDCVKKSQRWSAYQLNSSTLAQNTTRYYSQTNQYPMDPLLSSALYLNADCFWNTGFDHGHICPSADRLYSQEANYQTFFLTNMQPQFKAFNGSLSGSEEYKNKWSPWYQLEGKVRTWAGAQTTEMLYVVKGGTIEDDQILTNGDGTPRLLKGEMRIPKYFFVALLLKNKEGYKAVGFWMEHLDTYRTEKELGYYAVNIRELERLTGIDFFCNLPDDVENRIETLPIKNVRRAWNVTLPEDKD